MTLLTHENLSANAHEIQVDGCIDYHFVQGRKRFILRHDDECDDWFMFFQNDIGMAYCLLIDDALYVEELQDVFGAVTREELKFTI